MSFMPILCNLERPFPKRARPSQFPKPTCFMSEAEKLSRQFSVPFLLCTVNLAWLQPPSPHLGNAQKTGCFFFLESFPKGRHDCKPLSPFWFPQTVDEKRSAWAVRLGNPTTHGVGGNLHHYIHITSHFMCVGQNYFFSCPWQLNRRPCHWLKE